MLAPCTMHTHCLHLKILQNTLLYKINALLYMYQTAQYSKSVNIGATLLTQIFDIGRFEIRSRFVLTPSRCNTCNGGPSTSSHCCGFAIVYSPSAQHNRALTGSVRTAMHNKVQFSKQCFSERTSINVQILMQTFLALH